jgi:hypothetical protein
MESGRTLRRYKERLARINERLTEIRSKTEALLESLEQGLPTAADVARLKSLQSARQRLFQEYLEGTDAFIQYIIELEESNRRSAMTTKRPRSSRSQAKIEELSQELTTNLRLQRVDEAIKELLSFLADTDFFGQNATTARRRRLRTLQRALEQALAN